MTAGETILKFTDYPFAYSIVGISLGMLGFSLSGNHIIFLGMMIYNVFQSIYKVGQRVLLLLT